MPLLMKGIRSLSPVLRGEGWGEGPSGELRHSLVFTLSWVQARHWRISMIRGVHAMFYSSQAAALRKFFRDKLGFPCTDVGGGWLIFDMPEADLGVHPADKAYPHAASGTHAISFYCDDVEKTVAELKARGVKFTGPIENHGYGLTTNFKVPGGFAVQLYQPLYKKGKSAGKATGKSKRKGM